MEINKNELAQNYTTKTDGELLDMYSAGTLTDLAYEVLDAELSDRGLEIPKRPEARVTPQGRPQSLKAHWQGNASLASAYWIFGVLGSIVFSAIFKILESSPASLIVTLLWLPYFIFAMVSIWRCAWNSSWKGWGYIARTLVLLDVFGVLAAIAITLQQ